MFEDELQELLREIAGQLGAARVAIVRPSPDADEAQPGPELCGDRVCLAPLGGGAYLHAEFAETDRSAEGRMAAMERAARSLRTCARRWNVAHIPALELGAGGPPPAERARDRVRRYLQALVNSEGAQNALVYYRGDIVASARELGEMHHARVPFTVKRIEAEARALRGQTSHAEISGDDFFAVGFWFEACLIVFFGAPYSVDFIRHRARLVTRELAHIMPMLDDEPPPDPANVAPIPE